MIHLDTHVVVWLYAGDTHRLSPGAQRLLRAHRPLVSPMVRVELALLHEIGRLSVPAGEVLDALRMECDLGTAESSFDRVAARASTLTWTRDPFDRLIAAHALCDDLPLLTRDATLLAHCGVATWD